MLYRLSFEFRLTRLVPWSSDGADFYGHVEDVRAKVAVAESISDVRVITDIRDSQLSFDLLIEAPLHYTAEATARQIIRDAIEGHGARHFGMESAGKLLSAGARTGLQTPIWHQRRIHIDLAA